MTPHLWMEVLEFTGESIGQLMGYLRNSGKGAVPTSIPENYRQSAANKHITAWIYPIEALGVFRNGYTIITQMENCQITFGNKRLVTPPSY